MTIWLAAIPSPGSLAVSVFSAVSTTEVEVVMSKYGGRPFCVFRW